MKTILVTGAAGFIGSHLSERLVEYGYEVIGIDNFDSFYDRKIKESNISEVLQHPNFTLHELDLLDNQSLSSINNKVDVVIHLAAKAGVLPSLENAQSYINVNVLGTTNVLEYMKSNNIKKLLFASSSSVYGNNNKIPFSEQDVVEQPISPYAMSKRSCELINYTYHTLYNIDVLNLRFFTVYGPRQRPDLAIHKFTNLIKNGQSITMFGDGTTARDYTYVSDTVSGICAALTYIQKNTDLFDTINLGNESPVELRTLVECLYNELKIAPSIIQESVKLGDMDVTYADISKAKKLLNYQPEVSINDGIRKFVEWMKTQKKQIDS